MRKLRVSLVSAVVLAAGPALAADLRVPYKAPPTPAAVVAYNWSGFYLGIQGGYGWGEREWTFNTPLGAAIEASRSNEGGLIGGTWGYNWQTGGFVIGVEGDYGWADFKRNIALGPCADPTFTCRSGLDSFGTLRGRIGVAWDAFLLYGTGGLAFGHQRVSILDTVTGITAARSRFETGWTIGGGAEWGFASGWSAKIEALYFDVGRHNYLLASPLVTSVDVKQTGVIVRGGINYRFNWGAGPVVASY